MESRAGRGKTLILKAGTSNKEPASRLLQAGFTLLELVVVLFIVSLIMLVVFPKLEGFLGPDLPGTGRHLIATIRHLRDEAEATKQIYRLNYDMDRGEYWTSIVTEKPPSADGRESEEPQEIESSVSKHVALPARIRFRDIATLHQGKVSEGQAFTQFYPSGRVEKTLIHLMLDQDQVLALMISPLTGDVKVYDHYVEQEEKSGKRL
jgi:prepilin-type N-terminal cleavage/methylation domain-containing protein